MSRSSEPGKRLHQTSRISSTELPNSVQTDPPTSSIPRAPRGQPKGTVVDPLQTSVRLFQATEAWFGFHSSDTWTLFHSYAFDFSVWEIWGALLHGGRLVIVPQEIHPFTERLPPC